MIVLLPEPEGPTIAVVSPTLILKFTFSNTFYNFWAAVGYLNVTFLNYISLLRLNWLTVSSLSLIAGFLSITSKTVTPTTLALFIA